MKKNFLIFSIICLFLFSFTFTYSSFKNVIVGNITATVNNWKFILNVPSGTKEDGYYKVNINNTSGSFDIVLDSTGSKYDASYIVNLIPVNLDGINIDSLKYEGTLNKNSKTITVNYSSENALNGYIMVKAEGRKIEYAIMKNGSNIYRDSRTAFWSDTYRQFIKTITFSNDVSNVPSSCTEDNLCFDLTDSTSSNQVYGYLVDSGDVDSSSNTLYDLNIVSKHKIYAPTDCSLFFAGFNEVESINFNNNFDTSNVTNMSYMFMPIYFEYPYDWNTVVSNVSMNEEVKPILLSYDVSNNNEDMELMKADEWAYYKSKLTSIDFSDFDTSNVKVMRSMFYESFFNYLDLSYFDTSSVTDMRYMFLGCSSLTELDISNFNTSSVTSMNNMFNNCPNIITTINIMNTNITSYDRMFYNAATSEGAGITVNYIAEASDLVDLMINTKSYNSNIIKGSQI